MIIKKLPLAILLVSSLLYAQTNPEPPYYEVGSPGHEYSKIILTWDYIDGVVPAQGFYIDCGANDQPFDVHGDVTDPAARSAYIGDLIQQEIALHGVNEYWTNDASKEVHRNTKITCQVSAYNSESSPTNSPTNTKMEIPWPLSASNNQIH